ncbi:MAG: hypothetical protein ACRDCW_10765, partial [Sarcina sp.]
MNKKMITKFISNPFTITFLFILIGLFTILFNILTSPKPFDNLTKIVNEINFVNNKKHTIKELKSSDYIAEFTKSTSDLKGIKSDLSIIE